MQVGCEALEHANRFGPFDGHPQRGRPQRPRRARRQHGGALRPHRHHAQTAPADLPDPVDTSASSVASTTSTFPRGAVLLRRPPAPGPAPVHRFLPELIDLIWTRQIDPGTCSTSNCPRPSRRRRHGDGRAQGHQGPAPPLTSTPRPGSSPAPDGAPASTLRKPPLSRLVTSCMCRVAGDSCPQLRRGARGRVTCSDAVEHLRRVGMAQAPSPPALRAGSGSVWRSPSPRVGAEFMQG